MIRLLSPLTGPRFPRLDLVVIAGWVSILALAPAAGAQTPCAHDGDCSGGEICAAGMGPRLGVAAADVCVAPRSLALPTYDVVELNNLTTPSGAPISHIIAQDLNDRGQVVGSASGDFQPAEAIFRLTPGVGFELLAPPGIGRASGLLINERGDVLGRQFNPRGFFILRDKGGVERLERGINDALRIAAVPIDFNVRGDVLSIFFKRDGRLVPYRYTSRQGWVNLWAPFADLRGESLLPVGITDHRDIPLVGLGGRGGFVLRGGERLVKLGDFFPFAINEKGQLAGAVLSSEGETPAFFDPRRGQISLARSQFAGGRAEAVSNSGIVAGLFDQRRATDEPPFDDTLFTFDQRRPQRLKVVARGPEFQAIVPPGRELLEVHQFDINDRNEVVGSYLHIAEGDTPDDPHELSYFYFHRAIGVPSLEQVAREAGLSAPEAVSFKGFNERGQILLDLLERNQELGFRTFRGSVLLTPVD